LFDFFFFRDGAVVGGVEDGGWVDGDEDAVGSWYARFNCFVIVNSWPSKRFSEQNCCGDGAGCR